MAKRFFETSIWTQNKWFREMPPEGKLFWFYLIGNCDFVGVWEEDFGLASYILGFTVTKEEFYPMLNGQIEIMSDKKIWIVGFCDFQYDTFIDGLSTSRPIQSYYRRLMDHGLYDRYTAVSKRVNEGF